MRFGRIERLPPKKPGDASRCQELIDRGLKLIDYGAPAN